MCVCVNFILQFEHIGADTAIVTQKIFQLIGLANAVSIFIFVFLKMFYPCCVSYFSIIVIKYYNEGNLQKKKELTVPESLNP